jgi:uncharacterized damage-inducible protein DinB
MTFTESYLKELEREAITTRKMLERVPAEKYDWKPHQKSMSLGQLATHLAELPGWMGMVLTTSELDFGKDAYQPTIVNNGGELMNFFERSLAEGKKQLSKANDKQMEDIWTLRNGEQVYAAD